MPTTEKLFRRLGLTPTINVSGTATVANAADAALARLRKFPLAREK